MKNVSSLFLSDSNRKSFISLNKVLFDRKMNAEYWDLTVERGAITPTLIFQIKVLNDSDVHFEVLCHNIQVKCRPDYLHVFDLGQTATSMKRIKVEPGKEAVLSSNLQLSPRVLEVLEEYRGKNDMKFDIHQNILFSNLKSNRVGSEQLEVRQKGGYSN